MVDEEKDVLVALAERTFGDDSRGRCEECGSYVYYRPTAEKKVEENELRLVCQDCATRLMGEHAEVDVLPEQREELRNMGISDRKIEEVLRKLRGR